MPALVITPACVPQRYYVIILGFLGILINFAMRYCFTFALAQMAQVPARKMDPNACPGDAAISGNKTAEYQWSSTIQGLLSSSFFIGYLICIVPAGMFADIIGAKNITTLGSLASAIMTILTPGSIFLGEWKLVLPLRILIGVTQAMVYSPMHVLVANWAPKDERTCMGATVFAGSIAGNAVNSLVTAILVGVLHLHWQWPFYLLGVLGILWSLVFYFTVHETPGANPHMKESERAKFEGSTPHSHGKKKVPWKRIAKSHPFWAMMVGVIGHHWGFVALVTEIPLFFKTVLRLDMKKNGFLNAGIYVLIWGVSMSSGWFLQFCEKKKWITKIMSRKIGTTLCKYLSKQGRARNVSAPAPPSASTVPALGMVGSVYSGCNRTMAMAFVIVGNAIMGFYYASLKLNPIDLSPNFAGSIGALTSLLAAIVGTILPTVLGLMTPNMFLKEWQSVMWLSFAVMVSTNIYYLFPASADVQPWNEIESAPEKEPAKTEPVNK